MPYSPRVQCSRDTGCRTAAAAAAAAATEKRYGRYGQRRKNVIKRSPLDATSGRRVSHTSLRLRNIQETFNTSTAVVVRM